MNPISLLKTIDSMTQEEVFNYAWYELKGTDIRNISNYYHNEFKNIIDIDNDLKELDNNIKSKIELIESRITITTAL